MNTEIICIGNELLTGHTIDTNSIYISQKLALIGIEVLKKIVIGDDFESIKEVLLNALENASLIILTGGLGPTDDDITKKTVAKILNRQLVLNQKILDNIEEYYKKRGLPIFPSSTTQALIPYGTQAIENKVGTAPGIYIELKEKELFLLPGVPKEMKTMLDEFVIPFLNEKYKDKKHFVGFKLIRTCGVPEMKINEELKKLKENITIAYLPHFSKVDVRIKVMGNFEEEVNKKLEECTDKIRALLGDCVYGIDEETLEGVIGYLLVIQNKKLAIAESCTGGLLAKKLTDVSGSSRYFKAGLVAYSNETKIKTLGIPEELITKFGAVSKEVAMAMAEKIRNKENVSLGVGITGIAGPNGKTLEKPIGLVYIALDNEGKIECKTYNFSGPREVIRERASIYALDMIRRALL